MKLNGRPLSNFLIKALPFLIISTVALIALRDVLFAPGLVLYGDQLVPTSVWKFHFHFYPLWNPYGSLPVFNDSALWVTAPAIAIASALNLTMEWFAKLFFLGIVLLAGLSMYYAANIVVREVYKNGKFAFIASITAALVYMLNPWVMPHMPHVITVGYALAPLILVCFMKALKSGRLTYVIATAFLWSIASTTPHFIFFIGLLILSWLAFSIVTQFREGGSRAAFRDIKIASLVLLFYLPFNAFWILPHFSSGFTAPGSSIVYLLSDEGLDFISKNSSLINVIRFMGFWEPESTAFYQPSSQLLHYPWLIGSFMVPLFAFGSLVLKPLNRPGLKYGLYFSSMSVLLIFLGTGSQAPFPSFYHWLIFDVPFFSDRFGWLIREPDKWVSLLVLMLSFLVALTIAGIFQRGWKNPGSMKVKSIPIVMTSFFLAFFAIFAVAASSHYLGDYFVPSKVPQEFDATNKWLDEQSGDFKVTWLPYFVGTNTTWGYGLPGRIFYNWSCSRTSLMGDSTFNPPMEYYYYYIYHDNLLNDKTTHFGKYLDCLSTRYVLVHDDMTGALEEEVSTAIANFKNQEDMRFAGQQGFIHIFENQDYAPHIFIPSQNLLVVGGLDMLAGFNDIEVFDPNSTGLLYLDQTFADSYPNAEGVILGKRNDINDIVLAKVDDQYLITPLNYTDALDPRAAWAKASLLYWPFLLHAHQLSPESWDWDYGKGIASTYDFSPGAGPVSPGSITTGDAKTWQTIHNTENERINVSSDGESLIIDYTFDNESSLSAYAHSDFEVENWENYDTITLWVYGDGSGNWLDFWYLQTNWDGSAGRHGKGGCTLDWVGWRELSFTLPLLPKDKVSQFMISLSWDINRSQAGLGPHRIMIKDITLSREVESPRHTLVMPVEIKQGGPYRLYARVFENPLGGEMSVLMEGQKIASVNTKAGESNFVWKDLGSGVLDQGTIHITLENTYGFNAVNVLALIPEDVAQGYFDSACQFLEGRRTIHIWEGKLAAPRIIETGHIAGQAPPRLIATGSIDSWETTHNTENEDISISSDGQSLLIDYTFDNEDSLSVYAQTEFAPEDWTNYDTLSLSVHGDGSGNSLNFWYYQTNPDGSDALHGIGACILNWTGWKQLSFNLPQSPRDGVDHFMIALSWDLNKSQPGLGSHQIKVEDIKIDVTAWRSTGGQGHIDRLGSEDGALVLDYTFEDENSLSVYAHTEFEPEDWTYRDTLSLSVYGDGSGNSLNFWYYQANPDGSVALHGIGACTLNWMGWKQLSFNLPQSPRDRVDQFMIALSWDLNKSQAGLGSHQIKVEDIVISMGPPEAATTSIDMLKDSHYQIGVLAPTSPDREPITLKVNNQEVEIDLTSDEEGLKWVYSEPIFLYRGEHTLQVYKGEAVIDRLMIFSTNSEDGQEYIPPAASISWQDINATNNNEDTLEDIFQANGSPAIITSFRDISETKSIAHVDAQSPFMLAFAENYNTQWVAKVNGKEYKSQPLYAVINGFWIDETGELEITVEYEPQRWFNYGAIISVVSLLGAFAFVVWDLRLKRDQRMRSRFRRWFSYGVANTVAIMRGALALISRYWRPVRRERR